LDWTECPIFLFDKEEGGGKGGLRGTNIPSVQHICEEDIESFLFFWVEGVYLAVVGWDGVWLKVNGMVPLSKLGECPGGSFFEDAAKREILKGNHLFQCFTFLLCILNHCKGGRLCGLFDIYLVWYTYVEGVSLIYSVILGGHDEVTDESFLSFIVNGRDVW
jgi:hypothetical protein